MRGRGRGETIYAIAQEGERHDWRGFIPTRIGVLFVLKGVDLVKPALLELDCHRPLGDQLHILLRWGGS